MSTFADHVIQFNLGLSDAGRLPKDIRLLNPFRENSEILSLNRAFYRKFYNDRKTRKMILGINPGRLGAGSTGIPFTDTKRLNDVCKIDFGSFVTHEPSSVFIYDLIAKYGGVKKFYRDFYINSLCPLGFIRKNGRNNWVNCNYYDDRRLFKSVEGFICASLKKQVGFGIDTTTCFVLGIKNAAYFKLINEKEKLFDSMVVLEHPRFIEQYQSKNREQYLENYLDKLIARPRV